jgi:hypothetical protein
MLCLLWQLVCPLSDSASFLLYQVTRMDRDPGFDNSDPSNVGLAVTVAKDSCPTALGSSCVFVDTSHITSAISGYLSYQYYLTLGFRASEPSDVVEVSLVDQSLAGFGGLSERGRFSFSPSSARVMRDTRSYEATPVALQLTRRRKLKTVWRWPWWWPWGWKWRNKSPHPGPQLLPGRGPAQECRQGLHAPP